MSEARTVTISYPKDWETRDDGRIGELYRQALIDHHAQRDDWLKSELKRLGLRGIDVYVRSAYQSRDAMTGEVLKLVVDILERGQDGGAEVVLSHGEFTIRIGE